MGLILATTGSILQFSDGVQAIPQIAGAPEIFEKKFETGILIGNGGAITVPSGAFVNVLAGGINSNAGVQKNVYTRINSILKPTSSLRNREEFATTGSYILVYNSADHRLIVGPVSSGTNGLENCVIRYQKQDSNSNMIMVTGSISSISRINGQQAISSSDPYASIELIGTQGGWRIVSMYGTWA